MSMEHGLPPAPSRTIEERRDQRQYRSLPGHLSVTRAMTAKVMTRSASASSVRLASLVQNGIACFSAGTLTVRVWETKRSWTHWLPGTLAQPISRCHLVPSSRDELNPQACVQSSSQSWYMKNGSNSMQLRHATTNEYQRWGRLKW